MSTSMDVDAKKGIVSVYLTQRIGAQSGEPKEAFRRAAGKNVAK